MRLTIKQTTAALLPQGRQLDLNSVLQASVLIQLEAPLRYLPPGKRGIDGEKCALAKKAEIFRVNVGKKLEFRFYHFNLKKWIVSC